MGNEATTLVKKDIVLEKMTQAKLNLQARLPQGIDKDRFFLGILTAIQKSKANANPGKSLADCDPNSVLLAAYDAAEVGCSLSPALALGWLIPYGKEAQFQPSYRFFIQKAYETGEVRTLYAEVVYDTDKFERTFAPKRNLFHAPGDSGERVKGNAIGAYALIEFMDGTIDWEYLTSEQIARHRNHSKQPNSMKWVEFWEEGWRITPIRVLAKRLPLKNRNFEALVEMVNRDADRDLAIPVDQITEPTIPRRLSEKTDAPTGAPAAATVPQDRPSNGQTPATEQAPAAEPAAPTAAAAPGSMFEEGEGDPYITPAEVSNFWTTAFGAGWKKNEVMQLIQKTFNIAVLKDLRKSQLAEALDVIAQARP
jgi:recombination protein RecT